MILRSWTGVARSETISEYVRYVEETGGTKLLQADGNLGYQITTRPVDRGIEITVESWWESLHDIKSFAGDDIDRARFFPMDDKHLVVRGECVTHHTVERLSAPRPRV